CLRFVSGGIGEKCGDGRVSVYSALVHIFTRETSWIIRSRTRARDATSVPARAPAWARIQTPDAAAPPAAPAAPPQVAAPRAAPVRLVAAAHRVEPVRRASVCRATWA